MILTIGPGGCGFTFLNWTISYLRGDNYYLNLSKEQVPVEINPLQGYTAHNFNRDHIQSIENLKQLDQATDQSIVYVVPTHQSDLDQVFAINCKKIVFQPNSTTNDELFARMYFTLPYNQVTSAHNKDSVRTFIETFDPAYDKNIIKQVLLECNHFFTDYYQIPQQYNDYLPITYNNIFLHLDTKICEIFDFLNLAIKNNRWTNWVNIYVDYRLKNQNFKSQFVSELLPIDNQIKLHILKEIINWKNGLYHPINGS